MSSSSTASSPNANKLCSFVTDKNSRQTLELLATNDNATTSTNKTATTTSSGICLEILQTSLSANNKFYLDFGDKAPFFFFKCYPVDSRNSTLVTTTTTTTTSTTTASKSTTTSVDEYVHPPVWGLCKVTHSNVEGVQVGAVYLAQLPMAERVLFPSATVNEQGNLVIDRPTTNPAYNVFTRVESTANANATLLSQDYGPLAVVCFPGIITGFGLYFYLQQHAFFSASTVVITSASSKVGLALALYLKNIQNDDDDTQSQTTTKHIKVIGYTSDQNKEFCQQTGLYHKLLGYNETMPPNSDEESSKCVMIDIAGKGTVYTNNVKSRSVNIVKLLVIGNSSATPDKQSTFATCFSPLGKVKMILTMMGAPPILRKWMNPKQELFLVADIAATLQQEWGLDKYKATYEDYSLRFCQAASKWISIRNCDTEESIRQAFVDIVQGNVPPSQAIVMDVQKAVAHRKTTT